MVSWSKICDILEKYANRENEMAYQKSIIDLLLETNLGWHKDQIKEQPSMQLGSTKRLVPDVVITKDSRNKFIMEVKVPSHVRTQKDIDQLISYMKQLETPVGIYVGKELEVYFKNIGDGSDPKLVMHLEFKPGDEHSEDFMTLFSEPGFTIHKVIDYLKEYEKNLVYESKVNDLISHILSPDFREELKMIISTHFSNRGDDVVKAALETIKFDINKSCEAQELTDSTNTPFQSCLSPQNKDQRIRHKGRNNGIVQRYAYDLIKQIIKKNPTLNFRQMYAIFNRKNRIEDITQVKDETRWFMDEEDIIQIADGTKIVVSNQWGFNGHCKDKMDSLLEIAKQYGIETPLP